MPQLRKPEGRRPLPRVRVLVKLRWQLYTFKGAPVERTAYVTPGFDCRGGCTHDPPRDHGCHGDEWHLAMRLPDYALDLALYTDVLDGKRLTGARRLLDVAFAFRHSAFPTQEETIRRGDDAEDCPLLGGCYTDGEALGREAEEIWLPTHTEYAEGFALDDHATVARRLLAMEGPWGRLAERMLAHRERALEAHLTLPRQCQGCKGRGTIPRLGTGSLARDTADQALTMLYDYARHGDPKEERLHYAKEYLALVLVGATDEDLEHARMAAVDRIERERDGRKAE